MHNWDVMTTFRWSHSLFRQTHSRKKNEYISVMKKKERNTDTWNKRHNSWYRTRYWHTFPRNYTIEKIKRNRVIAPKATLWLSEENLQKNNQELTYLEFIPAMRGDGKLSYRNELISTQHSWLINILLEYIKVKLCSISFY